MRLRLLAIAVLVVTFVALSPTPASAKSFRIAAIQVEAQLFPNGNMRVAEHITYDFEGEFHNGHRGIPAGDYSITEISVTDERGAPLPFEGSADALTWHYDARDERRTFTVSYSVIGAAKVGPDVGELYWQFVGSEHPGVDVVRIELQVPGDGTDVRAWAHGPLDGLVEPLGNLVRFSVDGVPGGQFVEGRVAVPASAFPEVAPSGGERLPGILAEEQQLADEANAERARDAAAERRRERLRELLETWFIVLPVAGLMVFVWLWVRNGKEYDAPDEIGEYLREPPDDPPAFVPMLQQWGTFPDVGLSATIVDLAQRGYLTIEEIRKDRFLLPDKTDWRFTWQDNKENVREYEHKVLSRLFANGHTITQSELTAWCKHNQTSAHRWWKSVQSSAKRDFDARRYIEGGRAGLYVLNVLIGAGVVAAGVVAIASTGALIGLVGIALGALQVALTVLLRRRTPAGRRRLAEWEAFERFLRDFSQLEEAPVGHLILWERYLVYAVALGVTAEVARALAARLPAEAAQQGFVSWYSGPHGSGLSSIGSFADFTSSGIPAIVSAATPSSSSSSGRGGGGGFSGGGGGGGGGGSVGAS